MKPSQALLTVALALLIQLFFVHLAWNHFMPVLGVRQITWGEAVWLQLLSGCLFSSRAWAPQRTGES